MACFKKEANVLALRRHGGGTYLRQRNLETLHPEFVHADLRDLDMEASSLRWKELHIMTRNRRLACLRVSKL